MPSRKPALKSWGWTMKPKPRIQTVTERIRHWADKTPNAVAMQIKREGQYLQITYREAGRFMGEVKNDLPASIDYLQKALALDPNDFESNRLMGIAYGIGRQSEEAIRYFTRALEIKPDNAELMVYLGNTWFNAGDPVRGQEWHDRARQQDPQVFERLGIKK